MDRRKFLKWSVSAMTAIGMPTSTVWSMPADKELIKAAFGSDFKWGIAASAYQTEGAWNEDGKGPSIWDTFTHNRPHKIKNRHNSDVSYNFYHNYREDIALIKALKFDSFRFSFSWSRILPEGIGRVNQKGLDFYHRVIDRCLELGIESWALLYHFDLPQALEDKGGWANRDMLHWFDEYTDLVTREYGDKVKTWFAQNEPIGFTLGGYLAMYHAPGYYAPQKFLRAIHHALLCQASSGRIMRDNVKDVQVGAALSCAYVSPKNQKKRHTEAAHRMDILLNRLCLEPHLGMGYPTERFPFLDKIHRYVLEGDLEKMTFEFDFIGLQNYTQFVARHALLPCVWAFEQKPHRRGVPPEMITEMGWEICPEGIYKIIKQYAAYEKLPPIVITENGCAMPDEVNAQGRVDDQRRIDFYKSYLQQVLRAKNEGVDIRGYFAWTIMDNFEWAEGFDPRFGLVHVDWETQKRTVKNSGRWFQEFLAE
jgi:beta-glucosidase